MADSTAQIAVDRSELGALDAVETAARVASGELKASEAVAAAIERARALEPVLNAISCKTFDNAMRESEQPHPRKTPILPDSAVRWVRPSSQLRGGGS